MWKVPPPKSVLLEFCRQSPGLKVKGDVIAAEPARDWRKVLTGVERELVSILKEHGPVLERGVIEDLCVAAGMNRFSFHAFIASSGVISQYGHSVYGLLGANVSAKTVQSLARRGRSQSHARSRVGLSRDDRGRQALAELPAVEGGQHVRRDYRAFDAEGRRPGQVSASHARRQRRRNACRQGRPGVGARRVLCDGKGPKSTITSSSPWTSSGEPP